MTPPNGMAEVKKMFGQFTFTEDPKQKGWIIPDPSFQQNIVTLRDVAGTGLRVQMHKLVADHFVMTLKEALETTMKDGRQTYPIRMIGGYVPRHKMSDPHRELSTHAYGIAVDFNWDKNPVSSTHLITDLPKSFVDAFKRHGWNWGGDWPGQWDAMHFQFATGC